MSCLLHGLPSCNESELSSCQLCAARAENNPKVGWLPRSPSSGDMFSRKKPCFHHPQKQFELLQKNNNFDIALNPGLTKKVHIQACNEPIIQNHSPNGKHGWKASHTFSCVPLLQCRSSSALTAQQPQTHLSSCLTTLGALPQGSSPPGHNKFPRPKSKVQSPTSKVQRPKSKVESQKFDLLQWSNFHVLKRQWVMPQGFADQLQGNTVFVRRSINGVAVLPDGREGN